MKTLKKIKDLELRISGLEKELNDQKTKLNSLDYDESKKEIYVKRYGFKRAEYEKKILDNKWEIYDNVKGCLNLHYSGRSTPIMLSPKVMRVPYVDQTAYDIFWENIYNEIMKKYPNEHSLVVISIFENSFESAYDLEKLNSFTNIFCDFAVLNAVK